MAVFNTNVVSMSSWTVFGFIILISSVVISDCYNLDEKLALSTDVKKRPIGWANPDEMESIEHFNTDDPFDMLVGKKFKSQNGNQYDLPKRFYQEEIFTRRFINLFLRCSGLQGYHLRPGSMKQVHFDFIIDHKQLAVLQDFGTGKTSLADVDEVLTKLFIPHEGTFFEHLSSTYQLFHFNWLSNIYNKIWNIFDSYEIIIVFIVGLTLVTTLWTTYRSKSYVVPIINVIILIFSSGFAFTWMRMYQEAEAARFQAEMIDPHTPPYCRGQQLSWYTTIYYFFNPPDCTTYYRDKLVHPFVKIAPTLVLSETASQFFFHPVLHIGKAFGNLIVSLTDPLPWYLKIFVVLLVTVLPIFLILVIMICRFMNISLTPLGIFLTPAWLRPKVNQNEQSKYIEEVVDDKSNKKEKNLGHSIFSQIESKTPVFLMNWPAFKKIKSSKSNTILTNNSDNKSISSDNLSLVASSTKEKTTIVETDSEDQSISSNGSSSNCMGDSLNSLGKERGKSKRKKSRKINTPLESVKLDGSGDCFKKTNTNKEEKKIKSLIGKKMCSSIKEKNCTSSENENKLTCSTSKNSEVQNWLEDNYVH